MRDTMPFNEFERRANELFDDTWTSNKDLDVRLLVKDLLFEVRRLRNKLADVRNVLASEDYLP